ncbi:MAG: hypothetical protein QOH97_5215 [Actinoplanes sp.]|jgi:site-specific recombinase XerC|nr:hypothetical protein [Actinoplanes sp.]
MTQTTTRPAVDAPRLRLLAGDWTHPHVHREGPIDLLSARGVLDRLTSLPHWETPTNAVRASQLRMRRRGAEQILDWLDEHPGRSWQERWFAACGEDAAWIDTLCGGPAKQTRGPFRSNLRDGLVDLLLLRLIAPGYRFLSDCNPVALFAYVGRTISPEAFDQAHQAAAGLGMIARQQSTVRAVLAKLCLHTGKNLNDLDADDFAEAHAFCIDRIGHQWPGMHGAWQVCAAMGILPRNSSLRSAQRTGQRSVAEMVEAYQIRCHPVRDLLVRYLEERKPNLDYASLRNIVTTLVGIFWADLEAHHPGIDSIDLPLDVAIAWKERLHHTGAGRARRGRGRLSILTRVRAFYLDLQQWALEDPSWARWAVACPIRKSEVGGQAKIVRKTTATVHQRIRDRLPHLQLLADNATEHHRWQRDLLAQATNTPIDELFTHDQRTYQRVTTYGGTSPHPSQHGALYVTVDDVSSGERLNLTVGEDKAFWAWAIIETLRHTGVRVEELLEITHLALVSHKLPDTGEIVPLLQIVPSKSDQERLLLVPPELASVLASIIARSRGTDARIPLVRRYDYHERVTGPPLPHLFQRQRGWRREVISSTVVQKLLNETLARVGLTDAAGQPLRYTPHDFRRMFVTDAVTGGLPVHIAAKILGHDNISTTQHYLAVFQDELIRSYRAFLAQRRSLRPQAEYREPTDAEWDEFEQHFQLRKVELGTCGRPYGTPCNHEHACIRCPMLRIDPRQRGRLAEIIDNLHARLEEARGNGWLGEVQGLQVSLDAASGKLASLDRGRQTHLGIPTVMHTE